MGQVTLPVSNRKGYSASWEYSWENKINYNKNFNEDLFLKKFSIVYY